jgi:hypothetical protein
VEMCAPKYNVRDRPLGISNGIRMVHISSTGPAQALRGQADHEDPPANGENQRHDPSGLCPMHLTQETDQWSNEALFTHPRHTHPYTCTRSLHLRGIASSQSADRGCLSHAQTRCSAESPADTGEELVAVRGQKSSTAEPLDSPKEFLEERLRSRREYLPGCFDSKGQIMQARHTIPPSFPWPGHSLHGSPVTNAVPEPSPSPTIPHLRGSAPHQPQPAAQAWPAMPLSITASNLPTPPPPSQPPLKHSRFPPDATPRPA